MLFHAAISCKEHCALKLRFKWAKRVNRTQVRFEWVPYSWDRHKEGSWCKCGFNCVNVLLVGIDRQFLWWRSCVICAVRWPAEVLPSTGHVPAAGHDQDRHPVSRCQLENDGPTADGHPYQKITAWFVVSCYCNIILSTYVKNVKKSGNLKRLQEVYQGIKKKSQKTVLSLWKSMDGLAVSWG